jgi:hypothetical protein
MIGKTRAKTLRRHWILSIFIATACSGAMGQHTGAAPAAAPPPASTPHGSAPALGAPNTLTVGENASILLQTQEAISSQHSKGGTPVQFLVAEDVMVDGRLAIPRGAAVRGFVVEAKKTGVLAGEPELSLDLISLEMGGVSYPISVYTYRVKGGSKTPQSKKVVATGMEAGAVTGAVTAATRAQRGNTNPSDMAVRTLAGSAAGAGVGAVVAVAIPGPELRIPAESQLEFQLASSLTVTPVGQAEAARLAEGLRHGGATLYQRSDSH